MKKIQHFFLDVQVGLPCHEASGSRRKHVRVAIQNIIFFFLFHFWMVIFAPGSGLRIRIFTASRTLFKPDPMRIRIWKTVSCCITLKTNLRIYGRLSKYFAICTVQLLKIPCSRSIWDLRGGWAGGGGEGTLPGSRPHEVEVGTEGGPAHRVVLIPHAPTNVQADPVKI